MARSANFAALLAVFSTGRTLALQGTAEGKGKPWARGPSLSGADKHHALPEFMFLGALADRVERVWDWHGRNYGGQSDERTPPNP